MNAVLFQTVVRRCEVHTCWAVYACRWNGSSAGNFFCKDVLKSIRSFYLTDDVIYF